MNAPFCAAVKPNEFTTITENIDWNIAKGKPEISFITYKNLTLGILIKLLIRFASKSEEVSFLS